MTIWFNDANNTDTILFELIMNIHNMYYFIIILLFNNIFIIIFFVIEKNG